MRNFRHTWKRFTPAQIIFMKDTCEYVSVYVQHGKCQMMCEMFNMDTSFEPQALESQRHLFATHCCGEHANHSMTYPSIRPVMMYCHPSILLWINHIFFKILYSFIQFKSVSHICIKSILYMKISIVNHNLAWKWWLCTNCLHILHDAETCLYGLGSDNGLARNKCKAITWTSDDPLHWCLHPPPGLSELNATSGIPFTYMD